MNAEVIGSAAFEVRALNSTGRDMDEIQRELQGRLKAIEQNYGLAGRDAAKSFNAGQRQIVDQAKTVEREMRGSSDRIADYLRNAAGAKRNAVSRPLSMSSRDGALCLTRLSAEVTHERRSTTTAGPFAWWRWLTGPEGICEPRAVSHRP